VARVCLPAYRHAYTVGPALAEIFEEKYGVQFEVVRNVPASSQRSPVPPPHLPHSGVGLLYQGALNAGRGIETLLEAMQTLDNVQLWLAGEGDLSEELRRQADALGVAHKVTFLGYVKPDNLKALTAQAWLGLNLLENRGLSYYYSLANKFFDCVQAEVPVLTMNFPEYRALNAEHEVAVLLDRLTPETMVSAVRYVSDHPEVYHRLKENTATARRDWNWEREERMLLKIWAKVEE
jgi:glycosyltransferase involved in cell wall biosynthesis